MTSLKQHFETIWAAKTPELPVGRSPRAAVVAPRLTGGAWLLDLGAGQGALL